MPRSIFTKINIILNEISNSSDPNVNVIITNIREKELDAFKVFKRSGNVVVTDYCKPNTIRKTMNLMRDLNLISMNAVCEITEIGQQALVDYEGTIEQAILEYFHDPHHLEFAEIRQAIRSIKAKSDKEVPTPDSIYRHLQSSGSMVGALGSERFRTLLNILGRTGLLTIGFNKYYWVE